MKGGRKMAREYISAMDMLELQFLQIEKIIAHIMMLQQIGNVQSQFGILLK